MEMLERADVEVLAGEVKRLAAEVLELRERLEAAQEAGDGGEARTAILQDMDAPPGEFLAIVPRRLLDAAGYHELMEQLEVLSARIEKLERQRRNLLAEDAKWLGFLHSKDQPWPGAPVTYEGRPSDEECRTHRQEIDVEVEGLNAEIRGCGEEQKSIRTRLRREYVPLRVGRLPALEPERRQE